MISIHRLKYNTEYEQWQETIGKGSQFVYLYVAIRRKSPFCGYQAHLWQGFTVLLCQIGAPGER